MAGTNVLTPECGNDALGHFWRDDILSVAGGLVTDCHLKLAKFSFAGTNQTHVHIRSMVTNLHTQDLGKIPKANHTYVC